MSLFIKTSLENDYLEVGVNLILDPDESKHCIRVLRLRKDDPILITNGKGVMCNARIAVADPKKCELIVTEVTRDYGKRNYKLHVAIAITRNPSRFEWFLEKATEIGIDGITPLICHHSEKKNIQPERLRKVILSAMKQSVKAFEPVLNQPAIFTDVVSLSYPGLKFIAHSDSSLYCNETNLINLYQKSSDALILIGPEGDFSEEEILLAKQNGFVQTSLGPYRLRTETAGIVATTIVQMKNSAIISS